MTEILSRSEAYELPPRGEVIIGPDALVDPATRLAVPNEVRLHQWLLTGQVELKPVKIGARTLVLEGVIIQSGTEIGEDCFIDYRVPIGFDCQIGERCRFLSGSEICDRIIMGPGCVVEGTGFVCDGATLGDNCVVAGSLIHSVKEPDKPWGQYEPDPVLGDKVHVYPGAQVVGEVKVGSGWIVAPGAILTRDTPQDWTGVVVNTNKFISHDEYREKYGNKQPERRLPITSKMLPPVV